MAKAQVSNRSKLDVGDHGIPWDAVGDPEDPPVEPADWFPADRRDAPLELEIGSGKGTFLVQQAPERPDVNYLGLEYARAYWRHAADRVRRHALANARVVHHEAHAFLRRCPDGCFRQVHIYFPDPWPKKRHHKRRLIQPPFLAELHRVLTPAGDDPEAGRVRIATDHDDYHAWMLEAISAVNDRFEKGTYEPPVSAEDGELVGTNFERKYRSAGRTMHALVLHRKA